MTFETETYKDCCNTHPYFVEDWYFGELGRAIYTEFSSRCRAAQLASVRLMSGQVSWGSAREYQADEWAGVARLSWMSPVLAGRFFTTELPGKPSFCHLVCAYVANPLW